MNVVELRPRTPTADRFCPLIHDPCIRERCAMWISPREPVVRLIEGLPVRVEVEDCALVLSGLGALASLIQQFSPPPE